MVNYARAEDGRPPGFLPRLNQVTAYAATSDDWPALRAGQPQHVQGRPPSARSRERALGVATLSNR